MSNIYVNKNNDQFNSALEKQFLFEVKEFIESNRLNLNTQTDLNVFTDSMTNQPIIGISALKFYKDFIQKLGEKYNCEMITIERSRFFCGFQKRKVTFMHFYLKPKAPIEIISLHDDKANLCEFVQVGLDEFEFYLNGKSLNLKKSKLWVTEFQKGILENNATVEVLM